MKGRKNSGISPVVATVILVAVAIVIAIAVAFWASGLVGVFTRFEKLEIVSAIMTDEDTFKVVIRNTGSAPTQILQVVVQGQFIGPANPPVTVDVGQIVTCTITIDSPPPGITVELAFYSSGGKVYPTAVLATRGTGAAPWSPDDVILDCDGGGA